MTTFADFGIGEGARPYVIAELSGNHNGDISRARALIEAAAENGADCVKLQTYTADTMTIKSDRPEFRITGGLWDGYTLHDLYQWAHTPYEWHGELFAHAARCGIPCMSAPFDETAVDLLEGLGCPIYKVASFELLDLPLVRYIAETGKPMIMSTGMASLEDVAKSVETVHRYGSGELVLLHCISGYPTPVEEANLRRMDALKAAFGCLVGLSDHTLGNIAAITAAAMGAAVIEKHFTLARADGGPDAEFSMEPAELKALTRDVALAHAALGSAQLAERPFEAESLRHRRSIYVVAEMKAGDLFTTGNLRRIRPGNGLAPEHFEALMGTPCTRDIAAGTPLDIAATTLT